ncbi:membrane protein [Tamlana nanhaiensis]|uniref:Membrane protein n=1 Tax=Neotamlana nanhaiensis TaxID=1382798 RepID=A0A0D7W6H0_9FLAO|nr:membrane protein [Tamlana nanhaiensis]KJD34634.1 membrane protein [Tamlana nanhaiensis]
MVLTLEEKQKRVISYLKLGIWTYFLLLIFEGALRKWFLPFLATPLLIVRDPVAIWLIYTTWKHNLMPSNFYLYGMSFVGIFAVIMALLFGHGSPVVAMYGARILLFHFPVMFIMGAVCNQNDVIKIGKALLLIAIPMIVLTALQFYSPQSAWVNRGIGGDTAGSGFAGAMGFFRPPGTFSFTNGNTMFFSLVGCYVLYFWISKTSINRIVLIGATLGLLASIPLSISRTLLFTVVITMFFTMFAASTKSTYFLKILGVFIVLILLLMVLSQFEFFKTSTEAFTSRFEDASAIEGGLEGTLMDRYLGGLVTAISNSTDKPFFGYGIGMGTNAGSKMLTGSVSFLISEEEWGRLIGEMGALLGLMVIVIRLGFSFKISMASFKKMKSGDFLPWILLSFGLIVIPQGQWAQPTALGFSTLIGGLIMASLNSNGTEDKNMNTVNYKQK